MTAAQATQLNNLNNSNTSTNERLTAVNATAVAKASPGNCVGANSTHVNVTMNTTTSGVQCVAVSLHSTPQVANASLNMTSGFLPVASANNASVLNNSVVFQNGTRIGIGTTATPNILNVQAGNVQGITINSSNSGIIDINTVFTNGSNFRIATQFNARNLFEILSSTSPALAPTTNRLTINGSNGNVGIGEIFPFSRLSVNGGVSIGDVAYTRTAAPTNGLIVGGNVGINTTSPNATLHVVGVANVNGSLCINDDCRTGWFVDTGLRTNITDLQTSNTSTNARITSVNATAVAKASPGNCVGANSTHVNVTMNTTTSGVQCVAVSLNPGAGGDDYINVQAGIITANITTFDSRYILLNNIPNNFTNITVNDKILLIDTTDATTPPEAGTMNLYTKNISGRMMLKGVGPSGLDYPYQPSFFQNNIVIFGAGGSTVVGILGTTVTSVGTVSHPANNITTPYAANFLSAATGSLTSGTGTVNAQFYRGNGGAGQASGWFMNARVVLPDTNYQNSTVFVGLTSGTMAASVSNANPAGTGAGFQYQFNVSSNWTFMTDDGTTLTRQDTNIPFTPNGKTTDFYMFCSPGCNSISWRIDDVLAGTSSSGSKNTNLPTATTALRAGVQQLNSETIARNIRLSRMYIESDR